MQAAFRYAVVQFNRINETLRKFELQAFVDVINTADTYKLSRLSESTFVPLLSFRIRVLT
jgi:preprotein translocase subunit SecF